MDKLIRFAGVAILGLIGSSSAMAGFVLSIDPTDLEFSGPGAHSIPIHITHDGSGASSVSGYSFQFFGPTASGGAGTPSTDVVTGATEGLAIGSGSFAFTFNSAANTVNAYDEVAVVGQDIGNGGAAVLFSLETTLGNQASYVIDIDFQNAQRILTDISDEFSLGSGFDTAVSAPNASGVGVDTTFTLLNGAAAVPEPSSVMLLAACGVLGVAVNCRRRRKRACASMNPQVVA